MKNRPGNVNCHPVFVITSCACLSGNGWKPSRDEQASPKGRHADVFVLERWRFGKAPMGGRPAIKLGFFARFLDTTWWVLGPRCVLICWTGGQSATAPVSNAPLQNCECIDEPRFETRQCCGVNSNSH